jgi:hypothetical protein
MMMTEMDIETSVYNVHLTRLIAREDFIKIKPLRRTEGLNAVARRKQFPPPAEKRTPLAQLVA